MGMQGMRSATVFILSTEENIILKKISSEITKRGLEVTYQPWDPQNGDPALITAILFFNYR